MGHGHDIGDPRLPAEPAEALHEERPDRLLIRMGIRRAGERAVRRRKGAPDGAALHQRELHIGFADVEDRDRHGLTKAGPAARRGRQAPSSLRPPRSSASRMAGLAAFACRLGAMITGIRRPVSIFLTFAASRGLSSDRSALWRIERHLDRVLVRFELVPVAHGELTPLSPARAPGYSGAAR